MGEQSNGPDYEARIQQRRERCAQGYHDDPDNSGICIYCGAILDPDVERAEDVDG